MKKVLKKRNRTLRSVYAWAVEYSKKASEVRRWAKTLRRLSASQTQK